MLSLGIITWEFSSLVTKFVYKGQIYFLHGIQSGNIHLIEGTQGLKCFYMVGGTLGPYTIMVSALMHPFLRAMTTSISDILQPLLEEFQDIFQELKSLPSPRLQDHKIHLKNESIVVKLRPYRYPSIQKNEMERMVHEMLQVGIIRDSNNSFVSPIVMVKEKDVT